MLCYDSASIWRWLEMVCELRLLAPLCHSDREATDALSVYTGHWWVAALRSSKQRRLSQIMLLIWAPRLRFHLVLSFWREGRHLYSWKHLDQFVLFSMFCILPETLLFWFRRSSVRFWCDKCEVVRILVLDLSLQYEPCWVKIWWLNCLWRWLHCNQSNVSWSKVQLRDGTAGLLVEISQAIRNMFKDSEIHIFLIEASWRLAFAELHTATCCLKHDQLLFVLSPILLQTVLFICSAWTTRIRWKTHMSLPDFGLINMKAKLLLA